MYVHFPYNPKHIYTIDVIRINKLNPIKILYGVERHKFYINYYNGKSGELLLTLRCNKYLNITALIFVACTKDNYCIILRAWRHYSMVFLKV